MKKIFATIIALVLFNCISAQPVTGAWSGQLEVQGMKLPLVLHIAQVQDSLKSTLDSPMQGAKGIPVDVTTFVNNQLRFEIKRLTVTYTGSLSPDGKTITGNFSQGGINMPLTLKQGSDAVPAQNRPQTPRAPFAYNIEEVQFVNAADNNTLAGTLTTPKDRKIFPVVVMITGSGAQDRDETLFGHKPFWVIADHFTKNGIGVLRMDDRGVGGSSKGKDEPTSADFATDIDAAVKYLQQRGFANIGLVGHSEGGMIAPMVASNNRNVKFMVLMAGPGIPIDQLMALQVEAVNRAMGMNEKLIRSNIESSKKMYALIKKYDGKVLEDSVKRAVQQAFDALPDSLLPPASQREALLLQQVQSSTRPWFQYFIRYNPQVVLSKIKIPVLAINGGLDVQVTPKENLAGILSALRKAGNKNISTLQLEGLNHLFQEATTGAPAEYGQIEQTISPKALDTMTQWILKLK